MEPEVYIRVFPSADIAELYARYLTGQYVRYELICVLPLDELKRSGIPTEHFLL